MATRGFNAHAPKVLAALRVMTALLYVEHGMVKLFGFPPGAPPGKVPLMGLLGVAGVLEFVGGLLLVAGLFTRPVAFLLAGQMAVAYFMAHAPSSPYPVLNHGEPAILFCFIFLYLSVAGPGAWSVDGGRRR
ncbi:MAG: DoxX family protein [Janthinobacterium lividum]